VDLSRLFASYSLRLGLRARDNCREWYWEYPEVTMISGELASASVLRAMDFQELSDNETLVHIWEWTAASSENKNTAVIESAVWEQGGWYCEVKHRSVTDQTRLAFAKPNSDLPCFRFSYNGDSKYKNKITGYVKINKLHTCVLTYVGHMSE
jgi:hypothetical protein